MLGSGALRDATRPGEWGRADSGRDGEWISSLCGLLRLLKELNEPPLLYKLKKGDANMDTRIKYIFFNKVSSTLYNILCHVLLLWCLKTGLGCGHCRKWGCSYFTKRETETQKGHSPGRW